MPAPRAIAVLLLLAALLAQGCSGFTDDEPGWWCGYQLGYEAYDGTSCAVFWECESNGPLHLGAEDDPDPRLRVYKRHIDCDIAPGGGASWSCACYEGQQHLTTFTDPSICALYFNSERGWFKELYARARSGCTWPPLPD